MAHVVQTETLIEEGILSAAQGAIIAHRSRQVMVSLVINAVLCFGIIAAAAGFISLLADAFAVAIVGGLFLGIGATILVKANDIYRMFGTASALIGAGMLTGGATVEILDKIREPLNGFILMGLGALGVGATMYLYRKFKGRTAFLTGSVLLMTGAMHLGGLYAFAGSIELSGLTISMIHLYAAAFTLAMGLFIDVRLISALAIIPFAQMLDTGTFYWSAMYAFYSPESTLSILQLSAAMAVCVAVAGGLSERYRRHTHMFGIMAFIVANLCFLVGSLFGDVVGDHVWGPGRYNWRSDMGYEAYSVARADFEASALIISEHVYTVVWAILLVLAAVWAAHTNRRGIFNAAMTFGGIHAYTQAFETFYDEPLAYVIGGLAAVPLAWGLWRLNDMFEGRMALSAVDA